jgi:hypothetical protein
MLSDIIQILLLLVCAVFSVLSWWNLHTIRLRSLQQDVYEKLRDQYL